MKDAINAFYMEEESKEEDRIPNQFNLFQSEDENSNELF